MLAQSPLTSPAGRGLLPTTQQTHRGLGSAFSLTSTGLAEPKGLGLGPLRATGSSLSLGSSLVSEAATDGVAEGVAEGARARGGRAADRGLRANLGREPPDWPLGLVSKVSAKQGTDLFHSAADNSLWVNTVNGLGKSGLGVIHDVWG